MNKGKKHLISLVTVLSMSLSLLAGCSQQDGGTDKGGSADTGKDSLVVATMSETPTLGAYDHNSVAGDYMNKLTYSTLFRTDADLNPEPSLVDTYENVSDTEWLFHLKQGVKFHDGSELTAQDVAASITYSKTCPEVNLYNRCILTVEAVDNYTVKIVTDGPSATQLYDLCHHANAILPKKLLDNGNDFNENPIGSGPFQFVEWKRGDSVEFKAFEDYFGGAPAIKSMTWKIIPEGSSRTIALEAGEVDMIIEVEAMDVERIESSDEFTLLKHDSTNINWLMLNNEKPGLDNQNVRHAINSAINRDDIIAAALNGIATPVYSASPMGMLGSTDEGADTYDVKKAKEYMDASGVDPASVEMSIICSNDTKKRAAEVIQANLSEIGINCEIESMDLATYLSATADGNYTASIGGYSPSDMVSYLVGVYHSKSIGGANTTRLNDPEVDALIDQAAATVDPEAREVVLKQATVRLNELCSQATLYQSVLLRAYDSDLQGVAINAGGHIRFEDISWKA